MLAQGKANLQAPWLGITGFFVLAVMLTCWSSSARRCATPSTRARCRCDQRHDRDAALLEVRDLSVTFGTPGPARCRRCAACRFDIERGETLALVGEIAARASR